MSEHDDLRARLAEAERLLRAIVKADLQLPDSLEEPYEEPYEELERLIEAARTHLKAQGGEGAR